MRFRKINNKKKEGDERYIKKFLFFPKTINGEIRWLEKCTIKQTLHFMFDVTCGASWWEWRDKEWIN